MNAFHSDAWVASVLLLLSLVVLLKSPVLGQMQVLPLAAFATSLIPVAQYFAGVMPFPGQALLPAAYLFGFSLAIFTGEQWQRINPLWMERVLFFAILVAAVTSVFLALYQWLRLGESAGMTDIWVLDYQRERGRPYANMGQPNQLATLLVWGLLACAWAAWRGYVKQVGSVAIAALLLLGLALTQSRSGLVGAAIVLALGWKWRRLVSWRPVFTYCVVGLTAWYALLIAVLPYLGHVFLLETENSFIARSTGESRPYMWRMLFDAATLRPWEGYGWNQVMVAQLEVSQTYPKMAGTYLAQSHNLFLDLVLWVGFPLGLFLSGLILLWFGTAYRKVNDANQAIYLTLVAVIGAHAMVELPLHYAYFLLPVGLVMGSLNGSMKIWTCGTLHVRLVLGLWCLSAALLGFTLNDYFHLETAYADMRFQKANFVNAPEPQIPDAVVFGQLQHAIEFYALDPVPSMTAESVQRSVDTTVYLPSAYNISKLVVVLALNDRADDAKFWMHKAKSMMSPENYANTQKDWVRAAQQFPQIAAVLQVRP